MVIRPLIHTYVVVEFKRGQYTKFVNDLAKGAWRTYDFEINQTQAIALFREIKDLKKSGARSHHGRNGFGYDWFIQITNKGMWPVLTKMKNGKYILTVNTIR